MHGAPSRSCSVRGQGSEAADPVDPVVNHYVCSFAGGAAVAPGARGRGHDATGAQARRPGTDDAARAHRPRAGGVRTRGPSWRPDTLRRCRLADRVLSPEEHGADGTSEPRSPASGGAPLTAVRCDRSKGGCGYCLRSEAAVSAHFGHVGLHIATLPHLPDGAHMREAIAAERRVVRLTWRSPAIPTAPRATPQTWGERSAKRGRWGTGCPHPARVQRDTTSGSSAMVRAKR